MRTGWHDARRCWRRAGRLGLLLILTLTLSGCLGLVRPGSAPGAGSVTGAVKIVSPGAAGEPERALDHRAEVHPLSLRGALPQAGPRVGERSAAGPSFEYLVGSGLDETASSLAEQVRPLGFIYEKEASPGVHVVRDARRRGPLEAISQLERLPGVAWAGENGRAEPAGGGFDPLAADQWALSAIRAFDAWTVASAAGVVVAVVDTGIDFTHPELDDPDLWVTGWDAESGGPYGHDAFRPEQADAHGTAVAGIIGAVAGNGVGGRGVAPGVRLLPVRVIFRDSGEDDVIAGIREAARRGAQVINLSLRVSAWSRPSYQCSPAMAQALDEVLQAGIVVVAAAGNDGGHLACPASHPGVIAVGAFDREGKVPFYSAGGPDLDLVAPGGGGGSCVLTLKTGGGFDCGTGTSFAAPHVAGAVALTLGRGFPQDPESVRALLHMTAIRPDGAPALRDDRMGYGRLDVYGAVSTGIPRIMVVEKGAGRLLVHAETRAGTGGLYQVTGVPEGRWTVAGWVDVDGDGAVSPGDYYGEAGPVAVRPGRSLVGGADLTLRPYDGSPLQVTAGP